MNTILFLLLSLIFEVYGQKYPGKNWERASPESQGMSTEKLSQAFDYAGGLGLKSWCASVHRNGFLLKDQYWAGHNEKDLNVVWSISKAITSTLIGIAERDGFLDTNDYAKRFIEEWRNNDASNITLDMLMRHDSGRYYDPITDFVISQLQKSQTQFAIDLRMSRHEPGTHYQYNQMAIQTLERVLSTALNESIPDITDRELFNPLQYESDAFWQERSVLIPLPNDPIMYGGMWCSCLDLARFGTLWLHRGVWNGLRVFTDKFYEKGTTLPPKPRAGKRYHWGSGPNHKASGMGDQMVVFNPEKQLIITRLGDPLGLVFSSSTFVNMIMDSFLDGDKGTWDYEKDVEENSLPFEEKKLAEFLIEKGVQVSDHGEIIALDIEGWYEYKHHK